MKEKEKARQFEEGNYKSLGITKLDEIIGMRQEATVHILRGAVTTSLSLSLSLHGSGDEERQSL